MGLSLLNLQPVGDESDGSPHCRGLADASEWLRGLEMQSVS